MDFLKTSNLETATYTPTVIERAFLWRIEKRKKFPLLKTGIASNEHFQEIVTVIGYEPDLETIRAWIRDFLMPHLNDISFCVQDWDLIDQKWAELAEMAGYIEITTSSKTKNSIARIFNLYTQQEAENTAVAISDKK